MPKRKLIEAAIPLDAINAACKADKDRKTGTLRNFHKWFAPMPLPAWRALLFATLVDDPDDEQERDRLMRLIEQLVENGSDLPDASVLACARQEIQRSWPNGMPPVMDPFCGGGSTLVEAQRLGCATVGSDLNPVPVLITKVLTEYLPPFAGRSPLHESDAQLDFQVGPYDGVGTDFAYYGAVIRRAVYERIGPLYQDGGDGVPFVWLWCRTVRCPSPACAKDTPLVSNTAISTKEGERCHLVIDRHGQRFSFRVEEGPATVEPTISRAGGVCVHCQATIPHPYIRSEGASGRLGNRMMVRGSIDAAGRRTFEEAQSSDEDRALAAQSPTDEPLAELSGKAKQNLALYGFSRVADLFSERQKVLLSTLATEIASIGDVVRADGGSDDYAQTITALLGIALGKMAHVHSTQAIWRVRNGPSQAIAAFGRHDLPMTWDYAEVNPFGGSVGDWTRTLSTAARGLVFAPTGSGRVFQADARNAHGLVDRAVIATDPPYYNQIAYADLSDYFYVWLRLALRQSMPDIFATISTPKEGELSAAPGRFGGDRNAARADFIDGFTTTFQSLRAVQEQDAPMLVVYAFREQTTTKGAAGPVADGWEAILEAVLAAGLMVGGTWPIRGASAKKMMSAGMNALATYVVLVCRPRPEHAPRITRSDLTRLLRSELAASVADLQRANIAPVDLAQAVIGPGMKVFSRHKAVVETDGSRVAVADALMLINRTLSEVLDEQEGDLDPDTRWAVTWYEQHGFNTSTFGEADQLARAKGIAVNALVQAGIVRSGGNKVALLARSELPDDWDPSTDHRATAWEAVQHLVRVLGEGGETAAAELYARLGPLADPARELAYRLFLAAEKAGRTEEAIAYNSLVTSLSEIARLADAPAATPAVAHATEAMF